MHEENTYSEIQLQLIFMQMIHWSLYMSFIEIVDEFF